MVRGQNPSAARLGGLAAGYWSRAARLCMVAGPALVIAANLTGLNQNGSNAADLAWVANHEGQYFAAAGLFLVGLGLLVPAGLALAISLLGRGRTLGLVGGTMVYVGGLAAVITFSAYLLTDRLITLPGVDPGAALVVKDKGNEDGGLGLFVLVSVLLFVGLVVLAVGLARGRSGPPWAAVAIAVGAILSLVVDISGGSVLFAELGPLALLVGFGAMAWLWRPAVVQPAGADTR